MEQGTDVRGAVKRDEADVNKDVGNPDFQMRTLLLVEQEIHFPSFVKQLPSNNSIKSDAVDRVNIIPYGSDSEGNIPNEHKLTKDFIKFRFFDVVNRKFIIFRAILEGITDTITPEYGGKRYIGNLINYLHIKVLIEVYHLLLVSILKPTEKVASSNGKTKLSDRVVLPIFCGKNGYTIYRLNIG